MLRIVAVLMVSILVCAGCSDAKKQINTQQNPIHTPVQGETPAPKAELLPIKFEKVPEYPPLSKLGSIQISVVLQVKVVDDTKVILFNMVGDDLIHSGIQVNSEVYHIGNIGYGKSFDYVEISKIRLNRSPFVKITGACGAACHITQYVAIDNTAPKLLLVAEAGTIEKDLNGDGSEEIIASASTPTETDIYNFQEQILHKSSSSLNQILGALSVVVNPNSEFEAFFNKDAVTKKYRYANNNLTLAK